MYAGIIGRSGRRRMFPSTDGAADSVSVSVSAVGADSAGFRSDRAIGSIRGGVDIEAGSAWSANQIHVKIGIDSEESHRSTAGSGTQMSRIFITSTLAERCRR